MGQSRRKPNRPAIAVIPLDQDKRPMLKDANYPAALDSDVPDAPETASKRPSARAIRAERRERALCLAALEATTTATGQLDLELRLAASVFGLPAYSRLPRYRRQYVMGYAHGAKDGHAKQVAKRSTKPISVNPPPDQHVPERIKQLQPNATWHRHPVERGGGWVSSTAYAAYSAYVGPGDCGPVSGDGVVR